MRKRRTTTWQCHGLGSPCGRRARLSVPDGDGERHLCGVHALNEMLHGKAVLSPPGTRLILTCEPVKFRRADGGRAR